MVMSSICDECQAAKVSGSLGRTSDLSSIFQEFQKWPFAFRITALENAMVSR